MLVIKGPHISKMAFLVKGSGSVCLLQVVQHHAASQQHGCGVCNVFTSNTFPCVSCGLKCKKKKERKRKHTAGKMKQIGHTRPKVFPDFKRKRKQIILLVSQHSPFQIQHSPDHNWLQAQGRGLLPGQHTRCSQHFHID